MASFHSPQLCINPQYSSASMPGSNLFSPIQIGRITLDHRVVMAPLTRHRASKAHVHGDLAVKYYGQRAGVSIYNSISSSFLISVTNHWYPRHPALCLSRRQPSLHQRLVDITMFPGSGLKSRPKVGRRSVLLHFCPTSDLSIQSAGNRCRTLEEIIHFPPTLGARTSSQPQSSQGRG